MSRLFGGRKYTDWRWVSCHDAQKHSNCTLRRTELDWAENGLHSCRSVGEADWSTTGSQLRMVCTAAGVWGKLTGQPQGLSTIRWNQSRRSKSQRSRLLLLCIVYSTALSVNENGQRQMVLGAGIKWALWPPLAGIGNCNKTVKNCNKIVTKL